MAEKILIDDPFKFIGSKPSKLNKPSKLSNESNIKNPGKPKESELENKNKSNSSRIGRHLVNTGGPQAAGFFLRSTHIIRPDQKEKIRALAYWERREMNEIVREALDEYFAKRKPKPHPDRES